MTTAKVTSKRTRAAAVAVATWLALAAASAGSAPLMQLPDDTRPWTQKVAPDLMARAAATSVTGTVDVLIAFRQPAAVQAATVAQMRAPARLQWIKDTDAAVEREWSPGGVKVLARLTMAPIVHAVVPVELLPALAEDPRVDAIALNHKVHALDTTGRGYMHVNAIQPPDTGAGVGIAFLDTGVDWTHPELAPLGTKTIALFDYRGLLATTDTNYVAPGSADYAKDNNGHGTEVAGIAGAIGVSPVAIGVAPEATIVSVKVLDSSGTNHDAEIAEGINAVLASVAAGNPYNIRAADFSLGGYEGTGTGPSTVPQQPCDSEPGMPLVSLFQQLTYANVIPVVSAGNGGCTVGVAWPACISTSLAVGSVYAQAYQSVEYNDTLQCQATGTTGCTDSNPVAGTVPCYTDSGPKLDVWAPTGAITPTMGGGYDSRGFFGTSASAPYVAGLVALLAQASPATAAATAKLVIRNTGIAITDPRNGITRNAVQADLAVAALTCSTPAAPANVAVNTSSACTGQQVVVSWSSVSGAIGYTVQVSSDSGFANPTSTTTATTSYTFSSTQAGTFYFRVAASNACGTASPWSSTVALAYASQCGTTYAHTYYLSGIAHLPGIAPAYWYSDVSVLNPSSTSTVGLRLWFYGVNNFPAPQTVTLGARQQRTWRDVLSSLFALSQTDKGMIVVESTLPVQALSRTYSQVTNGTTVETFGQSYLGYEVSQALGASGTGFFAGLRSDGTFRTNLEFVNASATSTGVTVSFYTDTGSPIISTTVTVPAFRWVQLVQPLPAGRTGFAVVQVLSAGAQVLGSASVIDGASTDPTTIPMLVQ